MGTPKRKRKSAGSKAPSSTKSSSKKKPRQSAVAKKSVRQKAAAKKNTVGKASLTKKPVAKKKSVSKRSGFQVALTVPPGSPLQAALASASDDVTRMMAVKVDCTNASRPLLSATLFDPAPQRPVSRAVPIPLDQDGKGTWPAKKGAGYIFKASFDASIMPASIKITLTYPSSMMPVVPPPITTTLPASPSSGTHAAVFPVPASGGIL